ncbi:hypothetical protein [Lysinibacillus cavernae]|uniref:hypothetical protein n=1 Tax=Lysinibacillus cavernae TaxID=2666135 RepID=UPI0012D8F2B1|nr:hypothetical protein [Lysinibacillus cavernae]
MFKQLQVEHSLFHIDEDHMNQFKYLAAKWQTIFPDVYAKCLNTLDSWAIVLNSWIFLKSKHTDELLLNPTKAIYYSINTFLIDELEKIQIIQKTREYNNDDLQYFVAFQLGNSLDLWIYKTVGQSAEADLLAPQDQKPYFLAFLDDDFQTDGATFHKDQTRAIKILAQTIRSQNCFRITVSSAVNRAVDMYENHVTK